MPCLSGEWSSFAFDCTIFSLGKWENATQLLQRTAIGKGNAINLQWNPHMLIRLRKQSSAANSLRVLVYMVHSKYKYTLEY